MNKRAAFKNAKKLWPKKQPSRVSMMTLTEDRKGVLVCCHDEPTVLVIHNKTDLERIKMMCEWALENRK